MSDVRILLKGGSNTLDFPNVSNWAFGDGFLWVKQESGNSIYFNTREILSFEICKT